MTNSGKLDGHEVVQLYISNKTASVPVPIRTLKGFTRIFLKAGETKKVTMALNPNDFSVINDDGNRIVEPGLFSIAVGGVQPDDASLASRRVLEKEMEIK